MALYKIEDFNPNYRAEAFEGADIKGLDVYAERSGDNIGTIHDVLVDGTGRFRYFVIDTGAWMLGKKVLLPVGQCRVDINEHRIYARGLENKGQVERLPEYDDRMTVDYDYEERVRNVYLTPTVEASVPVEMTPPVEAMGILEEEYRPTPVSRPIPRQEHLETRPIPRQEHLETRPIPRQEHLETRPIPRQEHPEPIERQTYAYEQQPSLYEMNERDHQKFRLYEERLLASKSRRITGEVMVGKHVETETARVAVPVEKERVVIERRIPENAGTPIGSDEADFREGEVAHINVYEETADVKKQTFVREEVNIRKEVEQDIVEAQDTIRREELDINTDGRQPRKRR